MKFITVLLLTISLLVSTSNSHGQNLKFEITKIYDLEVPSASGISKKGNHLLAIGDDSPFLFEINEDFSIKNKTAIFPTDGMINDKVPKKNKPDFEAIEFINESEFIIFGSGSKSPVRDIFIHGTLNDYDYKTYNITSFYKRLSLMEALAGNEINIEGAAIYNDTLYLLNRINSVIVIVDFHDFTAYVQGLTKFPQIKTVSIQLPEINGITSGFSGATVGCSPPHLIFTSSVENTTDAYNDGAILGSFIGMVPLADIENQSAYKFVLIESGREPLKVESVTISNTYSDNHSDILLSTDSDGGQSLLIEGKIFW